jgi:cytochrome P450
VYRNPDPEVPEGHWAITRHADIAHVARNPALFSSEMKGSQPQEFDEGMIEVQRRRPRRRRSQGGRFPGSSLASVLGVPFGLVIADWLGWRGTAAALAAVVLVFA